MLPPETHIIIYVLWLMLFWKQNNTHNWGHILQKFLKIRIWLRFIYYDYGHSYLHKEHFGLKMSFFCKPVNLLETSVSCFWLTNAHKVNQSDMYHVGLMAGESLKWYLETCFYSVYMFRLLRDKEVSIFCQKWPWEIIIILRQTKFYATFFVPISIKLKDD